MRDMPWRDAIMQVLERASEPLHYTDIAQAVIDEGLRTRVGATPAATVAAQLSTDATIKRRVMRTERGFYQLRSTVAPVAAGVEVAHPAGGSRGGSDVASQEVAEPGGVPSDDVIDSDGMGLINAFAMFWRRAGVDWNSSRPKLLGSQQSGSQEVDFALQAGVYLLHDGSRVVYVGRVTQDRLGTRLWEHTRDRLSGRWDRFSWFGVRPVRDDGTLGPRPEAGIGLETLIATMEALLIEGLEPPQNRRQGDRFNALEFLQVTDPGVERQRLVSDLVSAIGP